MDAQSRMIGWPCCGAGALLWPCCWVGVAGPPCCWVGFAGDLAMGMLRCMDSLRFVKHLIALACGQVAAQMWRFLEALCRFFNLHKIEANHFFGDSPFLFDFAQYFGEVASRKSSLGCIYLRTSAGKPI